MEISSIIITLAIGTISALIPAAILAHNGENKFKQIIVAIGTFMLVLLSSYAFTNIREVKDNPGTNETYRNQKRHGDLTEQWTLLSNKLHKLTLQKDIETRPEERSRLDFLIEETKNQLDQVEKDLKAYEKHH